MDDMMKAVDDYLENNEKIIERMHRKGLMQDIDAEEQLALLHEKIKKYLDTNRPYAMLLMDLTHLRAREDTDYVSLTELAKRKNPSNPSYVIQSWLRDKNTIEFLRLWEKDNNTEFNNEEAEALVKRISESSFTLTTKVWIALPELYQSRETMAEHLRTGILLSTLLFGCSQKNGMSL